MVKSVDSVFPVNLLIKNRPCLVVGGGMVAARKIRRLLAAGADVSVLSPKLCDDCSRLAGQGLIAHITRTFEESDVEGAVLVFAATNNRAVNRSVLASCRACNIPCSCVDGNWADGDFTTPAITRHGDLTIAVSTNGRSCRQARMIKNSLARHIEMIESADLVVVGTDHKHLTIDERESFHLAGEQLERAGWMIMHIWGIHEFMILNTCNRIEVVAVASEKTATNGILRHLLGFDRLNDGQYYLKRGVEAYEHLCLVTAGMLSQSPGETYVASQIKGALDIAVERGWASNMMRGWVSSFLKVSKHIKKEIAPLLRGGEIEDMALTYLDAGKHGLEGKTVMVLGAGAVGRGVVKAFIQKVEKVIWCYHINRPEFPRKDADRIELCTFNDIREKIGMADIVVSATETRNHILHCGHAPFFNQEKPVRLVDLGMPRNIDPELDRLSSEISLVDLDGLKHWYKNEQIDMNEILKQCHTIVEEHRGEHERITHSIQGGNATKQTVAKSDS